MSRAATGYSAGFYAGQQGGSLRSARVILPIVFDVVRPRSVVDVGCGVGTWLRPARELGAERTVGLDGDWVSRVPRTEQFEFRGTQLEDRISLDETFDLAICLEVAEHLSPGRARGLVADLVRLAPNVLFGAAIPRQGGHLHVNEQWQSYWAQLFAAEGYGARDIVRPRVRWALGIPYWYRQNAVLYSRNAPTVAARELDYVHPFQRIAWAMTAAARAIGFGSKRPGDSAASGTPAE